MVWHEFAKLALVRVSWVRFPPPPHYMENELHIIETQVRELVKIFTPTAWYLNWSMWNTLIVAVTMGILIWYTIETHKIATQAKESNLRPVILRSGFIASWNKINFKNTRGLIAGNPISFTVLKNIVTSISGYIVINGYQYELLFGNAISQSDINTTTYIPTWGWQMPNTIISAIFNNKKREKTNKSNRIVVNYQDIEGTKYYTIENIKWEQKSYKGNLF